MPPDTLLGYIFQWHHGFYLWALHGDDAGMVGGGTLADDFSGTPWGPDLHARIMTWHGRLDDYHAAWDTDVKPRPPKAPPFDYAAFDAEGLAYARELASHLGPNYYVEYNGAQTGPRYDKCLWRTDTIPKRFKDSPWHGKRIGPAPPP